MKSVFHLITTINRGGAENQLLVLVKEQVKLGLDVHVIYLKGEPELEAAFLEAGASIHHDLAGKKPFLQPFILKGILAGLRPVVHAHLPRAELVASLIPARIKLFTSRHNSEPFFPGKPRCISNLLSRIVEMRSIRIIAISNAVRDYLIERGEVRNPHNVEVILYGYKTHFKRAQIESRMYSQIKHIGTISRLADQKDLPTMFAALKEYQISQPAADLAILGAGPIEVELKNLVSEMNLNSSVSFLGRSSEIYDFLQNLDVFMLTSKYEGFGMVLLEALDAGIPIVASNNSAIPEVLGKDFPGLCNTSDPNDFAKKILSLNEPDYRNMVLRHQETRLKLFDATLMCAKIDSIYSI